MGQMPRKPTPLRDDNITGRIWLTTFNDMVTLLMVFFVLLFSMGSLDVKRFKHFQNALQSAMGVLYEGKHAPVGMITETFPSEKPTHSREPALGRDRQRIEQLQQTQGLEARYTTRGIQLTLKDNLLFRSGSAKVTAQGLVLLESISRVIRNIGRRIRVEGHSDNVPISTDRYPSNWELSTERAIRVVKYFIEQGQVDPRLLSAVGYADVKPRAANDSEVGRAKNRRVEIILGQVNRMQAAP